MYGTRWSFNQYFLPKNPSDADAKILSTTESAAERYRLLYRSCIIDAVLAALLLAYTFYNYGFRLSAFGFLTPGLWERTGFDFWFGFFFELPFVIWRVGVPLLMTIMAVCYGYWGMKEKKYYKSRVKEENNEKL